MDLRFVPDDMDFDQAPRDSATSMPAPGYAPKEFAPILFPFFFCFFFWFTDYFWYSFKTAPLQHSKVKLSWDETDTKRLEVTGRKFVVTI
jgi:hypothetical protein